MDDHLQYHPVMQKKKTERNSLEVFRTTRKRISRLENLIHLIPKWRPINHSFVCMLISPLCLVNMYKQMRERGLINKQTNNLLAAILEYGV